MVNVNVDGLSCIHAGSATVGWTTFDTNGKKTTIISAASIVFAIGATNMAASPLNIQFGTTAPSVKTSIGTLSLAVNANFRTAFVSFPKGIQIGGALYAWGDTTTGGDGTASHVYIVYTLV